MADKDIKNPVRKEQKDIMPKADKPEGFLTVVFDYVGRNKHCIGKTFASYVNTYIAKIYKEKKSKGSKRIKSVE